MFGSLSFIAVGKQEGDAVHALPFLFGGGDELVDDHLGAIAEIAELLFPDDEGIGVGEGVAIFETQDSVFAEQGVEDAEFAVLAGQAAEAVILFVGILVAEDGMPVREGPALYILAAHADVLAIQQQAAVGQQLTRGPVDLAFFVEELDLILQQLFDLPQRFEILGPGHDGVEDLFEVGFRDARLRRLVEISRSRLAELLPPEFGLLIFVGKRILFYFIETFLQVGPEFLFHLLGQILRIGLAVIHEILGIYFSGVGMLVDEGIEMRLGELGIVAFVVAMTAVTYDVDKDVRVELLPIAGGDRGAFDHGFRVI